MKMGHERCQLGGVGDFKDVVIFRQKTFVSSFGEGYCLGQQDRLFLCVSVARVTQPKNWLHKFHPRLQDGWPQVYSTGSPQAGTSVRPTHQ